MMKTHPVTTVPGAGDPCPDHQKFGRLPPETRTFLPALAGLLMVMGAATMAQTGRPDLPPKDPPPDGGSPTVSSATLRWTEPSWVVGLSPGGTFRSTSLTNDVRLRGEVSGAVAGTVLRHSLLKLDKVDGNPVTSPLAEGTVALASDGPFELPAFQLPPESEAVLSVILEEAGNVTTGVRWWLSTLTTEPPAPEEPKAGPGLVLTRVEPPFSTGQLVELQGDGAPRSITLEGVLSNPADVRRLELRRSSAPAGTRETGEGWTELAGTESIPWADDGTFRVGPLAFAPGQHRLVLVAEGVSGGLSFQPIDIVYRDPLPGTDPGKDPGPGEDPVNPREDGEGESPLVFGAKIAPEATDENRPLVFVFVSLNRPAPAGGVRVEVAQVGGTAELDRDYRMETNAVIIAEGQLENVVRLEVLDDAEVEADERLELEARVVGSGAENLAPARVALVLSDNEAPGEVRLIWSAFIVNEAAGTASVRLARSGNHQLPGAVSYRITGEPALVEFLGTAAQGRVEFAAGDSQVAIPVPLPQDDDVQPIRSLTLQLENPEGGMSLGGMSSARLDVRDDDSPPVADPQSARPRDLDGIRGLAVNLATERGFRYVIEYADSPLASEWRELTVLFGNNGVQSAWDSSEESGARFYRYRVENEPLTLLTE